MDESHRARCAAKTSGRHRQLQLISAPGPRKDINLMRKSALQRVERTLAPYSEETGEEHQALTNLLTDLIEFCDLVGIDFDVELGRARQEAKVYGTTKT